MMPTSVSAISPLRYSPVRAHAQPAAATSDTEQKELNLSPNQLRLIKILLPVAGVLTIIIVMWWWLRRRVDEKKREEREEARAQESLQRQERALQRTRTAANASASTRRPVANRKPVDTSLRRRGAAHSGPQRKYRDHRSGECPRIHPTPGNPEGRPQTHGSREALRTTEPVVSNYPSPSANTPPTVPFGQLDYNSGLTGTERGRPQPSRAIYTGSYVTADYTDVTSLSDSEDDDIQPAPELMPDPLLIRKGLSPKQNDGQDVGGIVQPNLDGGVLLPRGLQIRGQTGQSRNAGDVPHSEPNSTVREPQGLSARGLSNEGDNIGESSYRPHRHHQPTEPGTFDDIPLRDNPRHRKPLPNILTGYATPDVQTSSNKSGNVTPTPASPTFLNTREQERETPHLNLESIRRQLLITPEPSDRDDGDDENKQNQRQSPSLHPGRADSPRPSLHTHSRSATPQPQNPQGQHATSLTVETMRRLMSTPDRPAETPEDRGRQYGRRTDIPAWRDEIEAILAVPRPRHSLGTVRTLSDGEDEPEPLQRYGRTGR